MTLKIQTKEYRPWWRYRIVAEETEGKHAVHYGSSNYTSPEKAVAAAHRWLDLAKGRYDESEGWS